MVGSSFPVPTSSLSKYIPHRPPMVWIDQVLRAGPGEGVCEVKLDVQAHYFDNHQCIRSSSYIEWVAQAYAYSQVCHFLLQPREDRKPLSRAFLVGVRDFQWRANIDGVKAPVKIEVFTIKEMPPLSVIEGRITQGARLLGSGTVKLFAE